MLTQKKILLVVTGGVAAYKALDIMRLIMAQDADVQIILTDNAKKFVTELAFTSLSKQKIYDDLFSLTDEQEMGHITLARMFDAILIAPATANFINKMASGLADDLASTIALVTESPIFIAPSMNPTMYSNKATQRSINLLQQHDNITFLEPAYGNTACGEHGLGRMQEVDGVVASLRHYFNPHPMLHGKHIVLTAGPTREGIDDVRYISNYSSGKQAYAIANYFSSLGAHVSLISGPVEQHIIQYMHTNIALYNVEHARDMLAQSLHIIDTQPTDAFIGVAAVCDWRIKTYYDGKLKKNDDNDILTLELEKNPDILATIGHHDKRPRCVIGFAAESTYDEPMLYDKKKRKNCDILCCNIISATTPIFGQDTTHITLIKNDTIIKLEQCSKNDIAAILAQELAMFFADHVGI